MQAKKRAESKSFFLINEKNQIFEAVAIREENLEILFILSFQESKTPILFQ